MRTNPFDSHFLFTTIYRSKLKNLDIDNNKWLFVAPKSDVLTVLYSNYEPTGTGSGKLQLNRICKGYESMILIQAHSTVVSNHTNKVIIPPLSLEYDCSGNEGQNFKLNYTCVYF
jgi:hypothetical protein